jgi:hypothetical protein
VTFTIKYCSLAWIFPEFSWNIFISVHCCVENNKYAQHASDIILCCYFQRIKLEHQARESAYSTRLISVSTVDVKLAVVASGAVEMSTQLADISSDQGRHEQISFAVGFSVASQTPLRILANNSIHQRK